MQKYISFICTIVLVCSMSSCAKARSFSYLQNDIEKIIEGKDATIGIAIIIDGKDTISINGNRPFPMLSVYKLPIAIALGEYTHSTLKLFPDSITITRNDLKENTYSPMRDKYGSIDTLNVSLKELLAYSLQESDNNASDILLNLMPSSEYVTKYFQNIGLDGINISTSEDEMHEDISLCYDNSATPLAMASLLSRFDRDFKDQYSMTIKNLMESCATGQNRIVKPLKDSNAIVGHKTGTGFELPDGRLMAINDVGYIILPSGLHYSLAIFIENSGYDMETTEDIIAQISQKVYKALSQWLPPY